MTEQQLAKHVPNKPQLQQQSSDWSLSSIQQLKGLNLNQLREQEERDDEMHHKERQEKPNKNKITPKYPPLQEISNQSKLFEVGKVLQKVGQLLIVQANNCINLVDFDNWLFNVKRECVGFVIDIFGKVEHPYYAIKMLQNFEKSILNWDEVNSMPLFYAEGCKTLTEDDIRSIREKSSVYKQGDIDESSSQQQAEDSGQMRSAMYERKRDHPPRKASFEQEHYYRERTREKKSSNRHNQYNQFDNHRRHERFDQRSIVRDRQHNQIYLESMYNMYYAQMMQLYNGGQNGIPMPKPPIFPPFQPPQ